MSRARPSRMPLWASEFEDFPAEDMPPIPQGWTDTSWHNDAAPSFTAHTFADESYLRVWVDYADPKQRELSGTRFWVALYSADASVRGDGLPLLETDDWSDVLRTVPRLIIALSAGSLVAPARAKQ